MMEEERDIDECERKAWREKRRVVKLKGVMKMGNTVPRTGLKLTSLEFQASVLPSHHVGFPDVTTIPMPTCLCGTLPERSVQTTYMRVENGEREV